MAGGLKTVLYIYMYKYNVVSMARIVTIYMYVIYICRYAHQN